MLVQRINSKVYVYMHGETSHDASKLFKVHETELPQSLTSAPSFRLTCLNEK